MENTRRKPEWLKIKLPMGQLSVDVLNTIRGHHLNTICTSGRCPNQGECWGCGTATFMIGGNSVVNNRRSAHHSARRTYLPISRPGNVHLNRCGYNNSGRPNIEWKYLTNVVWRKKAGKTLVAASSAGMEKAPKKEVAAKVGQLIAQKAQEAGISTVVFDRNWYLYHGRIKELADAARNGGLKF